MPRKNLANVLQAVGRNEPEPTPPTPPAAREQVQATPQEQQANRRGRVNVSAYFDPAVRGSLHLILSRHPDRNKQDLLAEALDDLFAKYNVPQTARL